MRAAAILHPYCKDRLLDPFRDSRVDLFRGNMLERDDLPQVAIVFGGDGAVHRLLPALAGKDTPLLVVPTGSANDFARCIGIKTFFDALRAWRRFLISGDNARKVDLGVVRSLMPTPEPVTTHTRTHTFANSDGRIAQPEAPIGGAIMRQQMHHVLDQDEEQQKTYFCCISGLGLGSDANRRAQHLPQWLRSHGGYSVAALRSVLSYKAHDVTLTSFDVLGRETRLSGPVLLAAIGNTSEYGGGMRMLPQAQLTDGQLDLCFVPEVSRLRVLRYFSTVFSGSHVSLPEVKYLRARQVFVESDEPMPIYGDGELLGHTPVEVSIAPQALTVLVP